MNVCLLALLTTNSWGVGDVDPPKSDNHLVLPGKLWSDGPIGMGWGWGFRGSRKGSEGV